MKAMLILVQCPKKLGRERGRKKGSGGGQGRKEINLEGVLVNAAYAVFF